MSRRRRRLIPGLGRKHPILNLLVVVILALGAYWGQSSWKQSSAPPAATGSTSEELTLVERVVDGDTLVISGGDRVRLIGVDTPETKHPNKPPEPFGQEAYEFTRRVAEGKRVQLRFDPGETKDRYGRTLAYVYVDGEFLNEQLIREGLARALTSYPFSADMKQVFRTAEAQAKSQKRGIWSLPRQQTDVGQNPAKRKAG